MTIKLVIELNNNDKITKSDQISPFTCLSAMSCKRR